MVAFIHKNISSYVFAVNIVAGLDPLDEGVGSLSTGDYHIVQRHISLPLVLLNTHTVAG